MQLNLEELKKLVGRYAGGVLKFDIANPGYRAAYSIGPDVAPLEPGFTPDLTIGMTGFDFLESTPVIIAAMEKYFPGKFALCAFGFFCFNKTLITGYAAKENLEPDEVAIQKCCDILESLITREFQMKVDTAPVINFHFHPDNQILVEDAVQITFSISLRCTAEQWQSAFQRKALELTAASEYHKSLVAADPMAESIVEADISGKRVLN